MDRFKALRQSESIHYQSLCKARQRLELIKRANDIEKELEAKKLEMKKFDEEEKKIDLELLKMREK
tara:strand:+ start:202 stop:399 length:198 start_codon:yes stop_codon:yes gene_type:complete